MQLGDDEIEEFDNEQLPEREPKKGARFSAEKFLLTFSKQRPLKTMESVVPDLPEWDNCNKEQQKEWEKWYNEPFSEHDSEAIKLHLKSILEFYSGEEDGWKNYSKEKNVKDYSVGWEKHKPWKKYTDKDGKVKVGQIDHKRPYHIHVFLEFNGERNAGSKYFDLPGILVGGTSNTHANIRTCKKGAWDHFKVVRYTQKDGIYITSIKGLEPPGQKDRPEKRAYAEALEIARDHKKSQRQRLEESTEKICKADPVRYLLYKNKIIDSL